MRYESTDNQVDKSLSILPFLIFAKVRTTFLLWLPWILRMKRPGHKFNFQTIMKNKRKNKPFDRNARSSRSLLAHVLDIDDDFRTSSSYGNNNAGRQCQTSSFSVSSSQAPESSFGSRAAGFTNDDKWNADNTVSALQVIVKLVFCKNRVTFDVSQREESFLLIN